MRTPEQLIHDLFLSPAKPAGSHDLTIRDLARRFGVTLRTLRFYEDRGILKPRRPNLLTRLYSERDVDALELALLGKRAGMTLREILDLLATSNLGKSGRAQQLLAHRRLAAVQRELGQQRMAMDAAYAELGAAVGALETTEFAANAA